MSIMSIRITTLNIAALILLSSYVLATPQEQCKVFDSITMQISFAQDRSPASLSLKQIQGALGNSNKETSIVISTYSWVYKDRALLVKTIGDDISNIMLTDKDDGSIISKKMEQIYNTLRSATSIWSIKEIQNQLGAGYVSNTKHQQHRWLCEKASLVLTTDQNDTIISALVNYMGPDKLIEKRLGPTHMPWDTKTDSLGQSQLSWQRSFVN